MSNDEQFWHENVTAKFKSPPDSQYKAEEKEPMVRRAGQDTQAKERSTAICWLKDVGCNFVKVAKVYSAKHDVQVAEIPQRGVAVTRPNIALMTEKAMFTPCAVRMGKSPLERMLLQPTQFAVTAKELEVGEIDEKRDCRAGKEAKEVTEVQPWHVAVTVKISSCVLEVAKEVRAEKGLPLRRPEHPMQFRIAFKVTRLAVAETCVRSGMLAM